MTDAVDIVLVKTCFGCPFRSREFNVCRHPETEDQTVWEKDKCPTDRVLSTCPLHERPTIVKLEEARSSLSGIMVD